MSIIGYLTGNRPQRVVIGRDDKDAPLLTLDAALQITPSREVTLTKNPVESGGNITDHATLGNLTLNMEAIISEAPLPFTPAESAAGILAGVAGGAIGTVVGGGLAKSLLTAGVAAGANAAKNFALSPDIPSGDKLEAQIANRNLGDDDFPRKAYLYLQGLQQDRSTVKVITRLQSYSSMIITSLSAPQTIDKGKSIQFSIALEQVQIVDSASVELPENVISFDATGASSKGNLGKQATSAATEAQTKNVSLLKQFVNGLGG